MVITCMPNYGHGGPPGARVMTMFVLSTLKLLILKVLMYMEVYGAREVSHLFAKFPVECRYNHVWGPIFDPSYDHFYKCDPQNKIKNTQKTTNKCNPKWVPQT